VWVRKVGSYFIINDVTNEIVVRESLERKIARAITIR